MMTDISYFPNDDGSFDLSNSILFSTLVVEGPVISSANSRGGNLPRPSVTVTLQPTTSSIFSFRYNPKAGSIFQLESRQGQTNNKQFWTETNI